MNTCGSHNIACDYNKRERERERENERAREREKTREKEIMLTLFDGYERWHIN